LFFYTGLIRRGVLNVITGKGSEIGDFLTTHPSVNCISFTGGDTGVRAMCVGVSVVVGSVG